MFLLHDLIIKNYGGIASCFVSASFRLLFCLSWSWSMSQSSERILCRSHDVSQANWFWKPRGEKESHASSAMQRLTPETPEMAKKTTGLHETVAP